MKESIHKTLQKAALGVAAFTAMGVGVGVAGIASAASATQANGNVAISQPMRPFRGGGMKGVAGAGTVTSISGSSITITNKRDNSTETVDASGATIVKDGATSTVSSIAVSDVIAVVGTKSGSTITATKIFDGKPPMGMGPRKGGPNMHGVGGTVQSVSGTTITVKGKDGTVYTVDESGAKLEKISTIGAADIKVGDEVGIQGTVSGTNVTAKHILDGMPTFGPDMNK